jgi:pimeloyl-ACP methyl ester carboxylesterase
MGVRPNIVLVHGAWADGSSWSAVIERLQADGYAERHFAARMGATTVEIPTNHVAMVSHPDDVVQLIETAAEAVQAAN